MDNKIIIKEIIEKAMYSELKEYKNLDKESVFIGPNSEIDSIDIMRTLSYIEDNLEEHNIKGIDLFDELFKYEEITFQNLIEIINKLIK